MIYWVLNVIFLGAITFVIFKVTKCDLPNFIFIAGLTIRLAAGVSAGIIFLKIYQTGDSLAFYRIASSLLEEHSLLTIIVGDFENGNLGNQPRVLFFVKVLSVFLYVSGGSYWIASLYFSLFSFITSWYFVAEFTKLHPKLKVVASSCFLFIPSVVFWSSGILKDTLAFGALLILVLQILKITRVGRLSFLEFLFGIISLILLFKIKHYLLIIFLLFAGLTFGISAFRKLKGFLKWGLAVVIPVIFFILTQFIHPYLKFNRIPQTIYENNKAIAGKTDAENQVGIIVNEPTWISITAEVPNSLFTGLFRPTIFDKTPTIGILHKIENFLVFGLLIFSVLISIKEKPKLNWPILIPSIFCICLLATLLALSTPNLGTLVRYKNAFMPFLFLLLGILPFQYLTSKTRG